jgi:soluble lytic murein transglycosylase-like protein
MTFNQVQTTVSQNNNSPFSNELVISICWAESSFNPNAKSPTSSATGLMMMTTGAIDTVNNNTPAGTHFNYSDMTNPSQAVAAGTWYLKIIYNTTGTSDKRQTLIKYGDGTTAYADKIMTCEGCLQSSVVLDPQTCLNQIHP